jgi:predicted deacylase
MKETVQVGQVSAARGTVARGKLFVGKLANESEIFIPVVIVNGMNDGPVLWLNTGIHGNEINGVVAVQRLLKSLKPEELNGTIIATLLSNPLAFKDKQRETRLDGGNLCDSFPGKEDGTITQQMAYVLFEEIKKHAEFLIDYHSWGMGHDGKPYAVIKVCEDVEVSRKTEEMARLFGAPMICKLDLTQPLDEPSPLEGALDVNCAKFGIPSFMAETGHAGWIEEEYIDFTIEGSKNIMKQLGLIAGEPKVFKDQLILGSRSLLRCKRDGIAIVEVKPQQLVKKGQRIAYIVNAYGDVVDEVIAPKDLYPISLRYEPSVNVGDRIAFVGYI